MTGARIFKPLLSILIASSLLVGLSACSIQDRVPDFQYPETSITSDEPFPSLVPTDQLASKATAAQPSEQAALASLATRTKTLRARSANIRTASIDPARIARLRARANRLSRRQF